ncbi:sulfite exporter TauE/SafE family protein [Synechococcus sp. Lug-A]|uniref:sulfite exporter TauE/SafE family protein n=1 Tax=Synechococcus sp. Lug-A TaxID=2823740 RepID=UPI0020CE0F91|nr:sulfite exporter TauE/SafE family protein [Synechococcus sp. Lug-A]MCP9845641.1 sulfite exporter TauE/SafE family protein [Synechococcus sp. Lug-A]
MAFNAGTGAMEPGAVGLTALVGVIAFLYSAVGQAGASGYVAALVVAGLPAQDLKATALLLNVAVATISTLQFAQAGHLRWRRVWPFVAGSVPLAAFGGFLQLNARPFELLVGAILLASSLRLIFKASGSSPGRVPTPPAFGSALGSGAVIGLVGGLSGTGGGVILSPLMLIKGWASAAEVAATSVTFILCNSLAALGGVLVSQRHLPAGITPLLITVAVAGWLGSRLGSRLLSLRVLERWMAALIALVGLKLLVG